MSCFLRVHEFFYDYVYGFDVGRNLLIFKLKDTSIVCIFVMIDSDHSCSGYSYHLTHRRHWNRFGRTANVRAQSPSRS